MMHRISISTQDIIDKSVMYSASDFRALRMKNPQAADLVYEDFALLPDNKPELLYGISLTASLLQTRLRANIRECIISPEMLQFDFISRNKVNCEVLQQLLTDCFVSDTLSSWYGSRDSDLSQTYAIRSSEDFSQVLSILTPKFTERRLRMF